MNQINKKMNACRILLVGCLLTSFAVAQITDHVTWLPEANERTKQIEGKIGGEVVSVVPAENEAGLREIQMILVKGNPVATVTTRLNENNDDYEHVIIVNKEVKYRIQIDAGKKNGVVVVTLIDQDKIIRRFYTDRSSPIVGVNL